MQGAPLTKAALVAAGVMGTAAICAEAASGMQVAGQTRRPQLETVADLRSGEPRLAGPALGEMARMEPREWGEELGSALLDALIREIEESAFGDDPHAAIYPMFNLAMEVAELGDVHAAPVLARFGGFGWPQMNLLVSLGEPGLSRRSATGRRARRSGRHRQSHSRTS